jgi:hypothetical protein
MYQEITLEYGVLGLLLGLWLLSKAVVPESADVSFAVLILATILRLREVIGEVQAYRGLGEKTRKKFWIDLIFRRKEDLQSLF